MKRITFLSLLIALSFSLSSHYCSRLSPEQYQVSPERYKTEYVVILVIDGPRYTETYGEKSQKYIPFLRDSLIPNGVFFESFYNNRVTLTVSGHAAITTGRYQTLRNSGQDIPRHPGIFHNFSNQYPEWQKQTWLLTSKGKLEVLADSKKSGKANGLNVYCGIDGKGAGYASDHLIMKKIESVLDKESPKLMLINLLDVDVAGHANDWNRYIHAIQYTDSCALKIWKTIQSNPKMKDKTTLFITNDHGRHKEGHKNGFVSHGDYCSGCRKISLLAIGPDFTKNTVVHSKHQIVDIAPTIAELLQFPLPKSKGKSLLPVLIK